MNELFILGSGNAFNINARGHTAFLLDQKILIDCGPTILLKTQEFRIDLSSLKYILITHYHGDHFAGIPFLLIYFKYILHRKEKLTIMGPEGLNIHFNKIMEVTYPNMEFDFEIEFIELNKNDEIFCNPYIIKSYPITHKEESIGYRIVDNKHSFAFTGDTILNEEVFILMDAVDIGIIELSLWDNPNQEISHVSLQELISLRDKINVKHLFFNHITDSLAEEVKKINQNIKPIGIPLYDGMKIDFNHL